MAARGRYDYTLLTVLGILVLSGLIILYSTSAYNGEVKFCDSSYYLKKQIFATCLGFLAMFFTAQFDYHRLKNMPQLAHAGDRSTASPGSAISTARFIASSNVSTYT